MQVRKLQEPELEEFMTLASFAFQFDWLPDDKEKARQRLIRNTVWGVWVDGRLASGMTVIPFHSYVYGVPIAMGGIAMVASWPEYRRQGHIRSMIKESLLEMQKTGQYLSDLFPFKESFYAAFGWERVSRRYTYQMPMQECPTFPDTGGRVRTNAEHRELDLLHRTYAPTINGSHQRTEQWWLEAMLKDGYRSAIIEQNGTPEGYLIYKVRDNKVKIREWVVLTRESRQTAWNFLANHDSMADTLEWVGPADGRDLRYLKNPPPSIKLSLGHMSRIVDIEGFFGLHPWEPGGELLTVAITDSLCPWNHGIWSLGGEHRIKKLNDSIPESSSWDLRCGIGPFTAISLGAVPASVLQEAGRIEASTTALSLCDQWFPARECVSMDFY